MNLLIPAIGISVVIIATATVAIARTRRTRARADRSYRRHRKIVAYQRAWDWLYRRKNQRLTYRPRDEGDPG